MKRYAPAYVVTWPDGHTTDVATCWQDLTLGQYARLMAMDADVDTYGWLGTVLGCTRAEVQQLPQATGTELLEAIAYLRVQPTTWPVPDLVHLPPLPTASSPRPSGFWGWFRGKPAGPPDSVAIAPPKNLELATFGQASDLGTYLEAYEGDPGQLRLAALAIYLMPQYHGSYDTDLLPAMMETVKQVRLGEGLPLADFFILTLSGLQASTAPSSKKYPYRLLSARLDMRNLVPAGSRMPLPVRLLEAMRYRFQRFTSGPGVK